MSTKFHHGYRVKTDSTAEMFALLKAFREQAYPWYQQESTRAFARLTALLHDRAAYAPELRSDYEDTSPFIGAFTRTADRQEKLRTTRRRAPDVDFECEIALVPDLEDATTLYALVYTEHGAYHQFWADLPAVEPYPYWNSTDRPDDVTAEEWEQRRIVWDRVVGWDPPAERGVTFTLVGDFQAPPSLEACLAAQPSPGDRARVVASDIAAARLLSAQDEDQPEPRTIVSLLFSDEFKSLRQEIATALEPRMRPLSQDDITNPVELDLAPNAGGDS